MGGVAKKVLRLAGVAALIGWFVLLRPLGLGGPASYVIVSGQSMLPTLKTGDLVVTHRRSSYKPGDMVAFRVRGGLVIHRIVGGNGTDGYLVQGDNNHTVDPWKPTDAAIAGSAGLLVPRGGVLLERLRNDPLLVACLAGATTLFILLRQRSKDPAPTSLQSSRATEVRTS
jgi:signal peptidase I